MHLRLGLEPTQPGLEPSQNPDWELEPTWLALEPGQNGQVIPPTEITHLVSGLNEAQVLDVSSQKIQ